jgi:molybdopterin-guanine dinucleotide biosynthesis protein A
MSEATTSPSTRRSNTIPSLHGLLVLGGQSTRMGRDKAFLDFPQSTGTSTSTSTTTSCPLYLHLLGLLHQACPAGVYISHNASQRETLEQAHQLPPRTFLVQDDARIVSAEIGGPAAGLLSAHLANPETTFLVLAVDFPLVTLDTLTDLVSRYTPPVTCYLHTSDNHPEPLLSIWGPDALEVATECDGREEEDGAVLDGEKDLETIRSGNGRRGWENNGGWGLCVQAERGTLAVQHE